MRGLNKLLSAFVLVFVLQTAAYGITTQDLNAVTPQDVVNALMPLGTVTANVTTSVNTAFPSTLTAIGLFSGAAADGIGVDAGIMLSSGDIANAAIPNVSTPLFDADLVTTGHFGAGVCQGGDAGLNALLALGPAPQATCDAAVLEFDFIPTGNTIIFNFVFASDEHLFPNNAGFLSQNDLMAVFIDGVNIALVPGATAFDRLVSVANVNTLVNPGLFNNNEPAFFFPAFTPFLTQYDGFSIPLTATAAVAPGVSHHVKIVIADAVDERGDSAVFMAPATIANRGLADLTKGDFNGDGIDDFAGIDFNGAAVITTNAALGWSVVPGPLSQIVTGDFVLEPGIIGDEFAGINAAGQVFLSENLATLTLLTGTLAKIVSGDFDGNGLSDIGGISAAGKIWIRTNLLPGGLWTQVRGTLAQVVTGDFNGDAVSDIGGVSAAGKIWFTNDLGTNWTNITGTLAKMVTGDFDGNGTSDMAGLSAVGKVWFRTDLGLAGLWTEVSTTLSGPLTQLTTGNFNGAGISVELAGVNGLGQVFFTTNMSSLTEIPVPAGVVMVKVVGGNFDNAGADDLAGISNDGRVWLSTDLTTWTEVTLP